MENNEKTPSELINEHRDAKKDLRIAMSDADDETAVNTMKDHMLTVIERLRSKHDGIIMCFAPGIGSPERQDGESQAFELLCSGNIRFAARVAAEIVAAYEIDLMLLVAELVSVRREKSNRDPKIVTP